MKISPREGFGPRVYRTARGLYPSVTEVLRVLEKPYYDQWRARVGHKEADKVTKAAQTFGTKLHAAANLVAQDLDAAVEREMRPYAAAVRSWFDGFVLEPLATEMELVSPARKFGGTLDLYCQLKDGAYAVVDFKTTSQLTREHGLQTCAYAVLLRDHGYTVNKRIVVRVKREEPGSFYARVYRDHKEDFEAWEACLTLWWWRNRRRMNGLQKKASGA